MAERASKRSRSATKSKKAGKKAHRSKSAAVSNYNKKTAKMAAVRALANAASTGFLGITKKFLDTTRVAIAISNAGALTGGVVSPSTGCTGCLSCPAEGDSEQNRDGKRFIIDSLILKGYVQEAADTTEALFDASKVFVAVVLDTQTNGATMTSETCFKNTLASADSAVDPLKNLLSGDRFRILKSQVYDLTPISAFPTSANCGFNGVRRDFDWYIPFKGGLPVSLGSGDANSGKNADVANVVDNSLHVIAFSTRGVAKIAYNARIRFQG